ncbi:MAG: redoxin domain-containing protein, partial [Pseudomonadota bacterium]
MTSKPLVGALIKPLSFPSVANENPIMVGDTNDRWTILFVYRGRHCPRCKRYLNKLNNALADWESAMNVVVVSADTKEKAIADQQEFGWNFNLGYG